MRNNTKGAKEELKMRESSSGGEGREGEKKVDSN